MITGQIESSAWHSSVNDPAIARASYNGNNVNDFVPHSTIQMEEEENLITSFFDRSVCRKQLALRLMLPIESLDTWLTAKVALGVKTLNKQFNRIIVCDSNRGDIHECLSDVKQLYSEIQSLSIGIPTTSSFPVTCNKNSNEMKLFYIQNQCFNETQEAGIELFCQRSISDSELASLCNVSIKALGELLLTIIETDVKKLTAELEKKVIDHLSSLKDNKLFSAVQPLNLDNSINDSSKTSSTFDTSLSVKSSHVQHSTTDEWEYAMKLFQNGLISRKQLALLLNIPAGSLHSWLVIRIYEFVNKLNSKFRSLETVTLDWETISTLLQLPLERHSQSRNNTFQSSNCMLPTTLPSTLVNSIDISTQSSSNPLFDPEKYNSYNSSNIEVIKNNHNPEFSLEDALNSQHRETLHWETVATLLQIPEENNFNSNNNFSQCSKYILPLESPTVSDSSGYISPESLSEFPLNSDMNKNNINNLKILEEVIFSDLTGTDKISSFNYSVQEKNLNMIYQDSVNTTFDENRAYKALELSIPQKTPNNSANETKITKEKTKRTYTALEKDGAAALFQLYNQNLYDQHSSSLHLKTISLQLKTPLLNSCNINDISSENDDKSSTLESPSISSCDSNESSSDRSEKNLCVNDSSLDGFEKNSCVEDSHQLVKEQLINEQLNEEPIDSDIEKSGNDEKKLKPRGRQFSLEKKESVIALYRDTNISLRALARKSGVSYPTLKKWTEGLGTKYAHKKYTAAEKKQALKLYRKGNYSIEEAAQKLNISRTTLNYWLDKAKMKKTLMKYSAEEKEKALKLHSKGNISQIEIARKLKVPRSIIRQWVHEKDYWKNETKPKDAHKRRTAEEKERALELYSQGNLTQNEVARQLKIPRATVQHWVHEKEYWANETKPNRAEKYYTIEEKKQALELYHQSNLSQNEVARQVKIPRPTLQLWINEEKRRKKNSAKSNK